MRAMNRWMKAATTVEQRALARGAGTSRAHLYQLSAGVRHPSATEARKLELASLKIRRKGLPPLSRESLCDACGACELARKARRATA